MRVVINAILMSEQNTGVGNYIYSLVREFNRMNGGNSIKISVLQKKSVEKLLDYRHDCIRISDLTRYRPIRIAWEHLVFPLIRKDDWDVFHAPGYVMPIHLGIPVVVTVHDLIALQFPELCKKSNVMYYRMMLPWTIQHSIRIIVPSSYVKGEVVRIFNRNPNDVIVIYEGVQDIFKPQFDHKRRENVKRKYSLPDEYLLFVGTLEPKKNIGMILALFEEISIEFPHLGLVLVGNPGGCANNLLKNIEALKKKGRLVTTGFVIQDDLPLIYSMATAFLFPSLIEGFGVPPLESMASGIPVITSNRGSLPEVVGSSAIQQDPDDFNGFLNVLRKLLNSRDLRQELIEQGLKRVKQFTWKEAAEKTKRVYETV